ncbi:unnamed protein product [Darwinula stevensoni]|uniref:C-type lectin domain-containing protein n=1 Tax=Darwinula stevensoni TaxID=69355 RepID=A0A7R9FT66_9CRUS|nr:unnamed protein product [Darwinula stevensoni]CAG0904053.1 unnamed protein product [Darwinula stevensoni]
MGLWHKFIMTLERMKQDTRFLCLLLMCSRGTALDVDITGKMFTQLVDTNATIQNPLLTSTGVDVFTCADSCTRNPQCKLFSLETRPTTTTCQLGGNASILQANPAGMSSTIYYDDALFPKDYTFAMITDQIHFIKFPNVIQNYTTARTTCKADGMGRLIMDDKGQAWHNWIWQYVYPKMGGTNGMWLGIDDSQQEGAWKWNDGTTLSTSFWNSGEPNGGTVENCISIWRPFSGKWIDYSCPQQEWVLCEVRWP